MQRLVIEYKATLAITPFELWPWLTETERLRQWLPGFLDCRFPAGFDPECAVGTRVQPVIRLGGGAVVLEGVVTGWEPPVRVDQTAAGHHFHATLRFVVAEKDGSVTLRIILDVAPRTLVARALRPFAPRLIEKYLDRATGRLASCLEANRMPS